MAVLLTSSLGVIITLVAARLWLLLNVLLGVCVERLLEQGSNGPEEVLLVDVRLSSNPLTPEQMQRAQLVEGAVTLIKSGGDRNLETGWKLLKHLYTLRNSLGSHRKEAALFLGTAVLCLSYFVSVTIGGVFSAYIVLDSHGLCKSTNCGHWFPADVWSGDPTDGNVAVAQVAIHNAKEEGAASHVARCYRGAGSVDGCDNLLSKSIAYNVSMSKCPLPGNVCAHEDLALSLDTGWQDARVLGISSPQKLIFRRRTTCAPLVTNETYVKPFGGPNGRLTIRYYYGPAIGQNYTFETPMNDLNTRPYMGTYIVKPRVCWRVGDAHHDNIALQNTTHTLNSPGARLLYSVLGSFGRIVEGIGVRQARALQAQTFVIPNTNLAVQNGEWKSEVESFFQMSLAMLQNGVVDIANGAFHDSPGAVNLFERAGYTRSQWAPMCDMVLVQAPGFKSVSLVALVFVLIMAAFITIASIEIRGELIIVRYIALFLIFIWTFLWWIVKSVASFVWNRLKSSFNFLCEKRRDIAKALLAGLKAIAKFVLSSLIKLIGFAYELADKIIEYQRAHSSARPQLNHEPSDGVT
ncbi:hypothetical protein LTR84_012320 [Exophiala bonariae]|uniref:Uncharacterized protein n=1 Tax=Exophiala bonariae TaxID=1690606 RepID=A0AAV9NGA1_9EURO|nr:hypothetical protein LTR84_012320 [Exophiala bonariae]